MEKRGAQCAGKHIYANHKMFKAKTVHDSEKGVTSLGSRFVTAREALGLDIERAARETRIKVQRLREIEADNLSHFSHPSYARFFLVNYAKYLNVPVDEISESLPPQGAVGCEGYQYLQENDGSVYKALPTRAFGFRRMALAAMVVIALTVGAVQLAVTVRKLERISRANAEDSTWLSSEGKTATPAANTPAAPPVSSETPAGSGQPPKAVSAPSEDSSPATALFVGGAVDHNSALQ